MKVRLYYQCTCCGSSSFRRSHTRTFKETLLGCLGVHPQRCHMCRSRFFLFKPTNLRAFLTALDAPAQKEREASGTRPVADASDA
ncbi:MAG TPA: hypothetical protein VMB25_16715 [Bryobacteraceae bacterium]|nr:hypothetical protein [Bryobacteraceae bacterium]